MAGQTALLKQPFKEAKGVVFPGGGKGLTAPQTTAGVGDGQGIAVLTIAQQELALVKVIAKTTVELLLFISFYFVSKQNVANILDRS